MYYNIQNENSSLERKKAHYTHYRTSIDQCSSQKRDKWIRDKTTKLCHSINRVILFQLKPCFNLNCTHYNRRYFLLVAKWREYVTWEITAALLHNSLFEGCAIWHFSRSICRTMQNIWIVLKARASTTFRVHVRERMRVLSS